MKPKISDSLLASLKADWKTSSPKVLKEMTEYVGKFQTPLSIMSSGRTQLIGTGSFIKIIDSIFIVTNAHVIKSFSEYNPPCYQLTGKSMPSRFQGKIGGNNDIDIAILHVNPEEWNTDHSSRFLDIGMISLKHDPQQSEMLVFSGWSEQDTVFLVNRFQITGTSLLSIDVTNERTSTYDLEYGFDIAYNSNLFQYSSSNGIIPNPHGFSGSVVWNTGYIQSRILGIPWNVNHARVTGLLYLWRKEDNCLVAIRSEHFLDVISHLYITEYWN